MIQNTYDKGPARVFSIFSREYLLTLMILTSECFSPLFHFQYVLFPLRYLCRSGFDP